MSDQSPQEVYRKKGVRLQEDISPLLSRYKSARLKGRAWKGCHAFDKAHCVMLVEEKIIPAGVGSKILACLREIEQAGTETTRLEFGGQLHSGEAYVTRKLGPDLAGWIHCGRSTGDLHAVGVRFDIREMILSISESIVGLCSTLLAQAELHVSTVMPGYTHLQHAEPITYGFYLMSFVHPLERDLERLFAAYERVNASPAGCAIISTTDFPINRQRVCQLLGFPRMHTNARDAIWSFDCFIEVLSAFANMASTLSRLSDDLNIWHSSEFSLVEHPDAFCGTSSIMPQKKNPYGTETARGLAADVMGALMSYLTMANRQSDSTEIMVMGSRYLYDAADQAKGLVDIVHGVVAGLKINSRIMKEKTALYWAQASSIANMLVSSLSISFRVAHQITGILVRKAYEQGVRPEELNPAMVAQAAREYDGRDLDVDAELLRRSIDLVAIVESKKAVGGTASFRILEDIEASRLVCSKFQEEISQKTREISEAELQLDSAVDAILEKNL